MEGNLMFQKKVSMPMVTARIPQDLLDKVRLEANRNGITESAVLRAIISYFFTQGVYKKETECKDKISDEVPQHDEA